MTFFIINSIYIYQSISHMKSYVIHNEMNSSIRVKNSEAENKFQNQLCFRFIIGITSTMFICLILWFINWFSHFSFKNVIHLLLTFSFMLFFTEKIIHIFEYKARYQTDKALTITFVHYAFLAISNFFFSLSCFMIMNGYFISTNPNIVFFILSLLSSLVNCFYIDISNSYIYYCIDFYYFNYDIIVYGFSM